MMQREIFNCDDRDLLLHLLATPTVGPLEASAADPPPQLWEAQRSYARAAAALGFQTVHHESPAPEVLARADVPRTVRNAAADPQFLAQQPSLVLRLGPELPREATVLFNVHLDTVAASNRWPSTTDASPGAAPSTRKGRRWPCSRASATPPGPTPHSGATSESSYRPCRAKKAARWAPSGPARSWSPVFRPPQPLLRTDGPAVPAPRDGLDDGVRAGGRPRRHRRPARRRAQRHCAPRFPRPAHRPRTRSGTPPGKLCVAGIHTGDLHNRVYGNGKLLINLSYSTASEGAAAEAELLAAVNSGVEQFTATFADTREFARTAADASSITRVDWLKRGLPCLHSSAAWAEELLTNAGAARWPDSTPAFTCDAIWMAGVPDTYTAVLGPGTLDGNNAHAEGEYAELDELRRYASIVSSLLTGFADQHRRQFQKGKIR